jgi:hypothetical protein
VACLSLGACATNAPQVEATPVPAPVTATLAPPPSTAPPSTAPATTAAPDGATAFCIELAQISDLASGSITESTPQELEDGIATALRLLDEVAPVAPPDLAPDVAFTTEWFIAMDALLQTYAYDASALGAAVMGNPAILEQGALADTDEVAASIQRLVDYGNEVCGI